MRRLSLILLALILLMAMICPATAQGSDLGTEVLTLLADEKFAELFERSSDQMRQAVKSAEGYQAIWQGLLLQFGAYQGAEGTGNQEADGYDRYQVDARFERAVVTVVISFDQKGSLAGLVVLNVQTPKPADRDTDKGERLLLRPGAEDETEAVLVIPQDPGPCPVLILMQGSGPNDKNESAYGMTPFLDLAEGLSKRGIATLRYDKYTLEHRDMLAKDADLLASFTMREEYVNDALAAWQTLSVDERFSDVFLLGHSQGAYAVPRVAAQLPKQAFRGLILLAGSPLPITALIDRQNRDAIASAFLTSGQITQALANLDAEKERLGMLGGMGEKELKAALFYGSLSGWYLKDEHEWAPAELLNQMKTPVLIIQGAKDWQVKPEEGIQLWQEWLILSDKARPDTDYLLYPDMTHLLFDLPGPSSGSAEDYAIPYPVSERLMDDLAGWIIQRSR